MKQSTDAALGARIHKALHAWGIESPINEPASLSTWPAIAKDFASIMTSLNLDLEDDSLRDTPERVARMYQDEIFYGLNYDNFPRCTTVNNKGSYDEMITTKCRVLSMCEHHFVPFIGTAHVSYIPQTKILGLSKFARIVDFFSRRPQIQERLTTQIAHTLKFITESEDIAVVIKCTHFCVHIRGIKDTESETTTSQLLGRYRTVPALRNEFLTLTR